MAMFAVLSVLLLGLMGLVLRAEEDEGGTTATTTAAPGEPTPEQAAAGQLDIQEPKAGSPPSGKPAEAPSREPTDQPAADETPGVDEKLVNKALSLGYTEEDIEACGTEANLQRLVGLAEGARDAQNRAAQPPATVATVPPQAQAGQGQPSSAGPYTPFELKLDETNYDAGLVQAFKDMNQHYDKHMQSLVAEVETLKKAKTEAENDTYVTLFDGFVEKLGKSFAPLLGEGSGRDMSQNSPTFKNRVRVLNQMTAIEQGRKVIGAPPLTEQVLFEQAINSVFAKESATITRRELAAKLRKQKGLLTVRPTGRHAQQAGSPQDRALGFIRGKLDEIRGGQTPNRDDETVPE
jgi:hypothetical protein